MRIQCPADNLAAECVQDDSEITELLRQMQVRDIGHPELIEVVEHDTVGKIGNDTPVVVRVRRHRQRGLAQTQKVVLAHHTQHPLVIGLPAFTPQESADPSVPIVAMLEGQALNGVAQPSLLLAGRRKLPMPIITGSADAGELTHALDCDLALRPRRRHRLDDFVDAVPPGTPLRRRCSLTCRKAC